MVSRTTGGGVAAGGNGEVERVGLAERSGEGREGEGESRMCITRKAEARAELARAYAKLKQPRAAGEEGGIVGIVEKVGANHCDGGQKDEE